MSENARGKRKRPPASGTKRSWGSASHQSDNSTAAVARLMKKARISEPESSSTKSTVSSLSQSNISLPTRLEKSRNKGWTSWEVPENVQKGHFMDPIEIIDSDSENDDIVMKDTTVEDSDRNGISCDEKNPQPENDTQNYMPPPKSHSISQDMVINDLAKEEEGSKGSSYDSCFGMIIFEEVQVSKRFLEGKSTKNISLKVNGTMVTIHDASSKKYGGLLPPSASQVVSDLARNYDVELSACLKNLNKIEVTIYGMFEQREAIGNLLLERDCFLQQPESFDALRPYFNPQCLSDSNEEALFWEDKKLPPAQSLVLQEEKESKLVELLDSATGPVNFRRVQSSDILITKLKEHQIKALSMMTEKESGVVSNAEFPAVWSESSDTGFSAKLFYNHVTKRQTSRTPRLCLGGLLADEMGLGKTLTTLALIAKSLGDENVTLIVCPMTTITCWQDQIERHFKKGSIIYKIYHGSTGSYDVATLRSVDIVLTTYETLRAGLPNEVGAKTRLGKIKRNDTLHRINWHRVVLDEAHIVRNRATRMFRAVNTLKARHRWCLSGTPIQNRLEDLGALVEFLRVDPFDNPITFRSTFIDAIDRGGQPGWENLRLLVRSITLRRTKKTLNSELNLPPRLENVHTVDLDDNEKDLYNLVKKHFSLAIDSGGPAMKTFQLILRLRQICNHGSDLLPPNLRTWLNEASSLDTTFPQLQTCEMCNTTIEQRDELSSGVLPCFHQVCGACLPSDGSPTNGTGPICPLCDGDIPGESKKTNTRSKTTSDLEPTCYRPSSKVKALLENLLSDRRTAVTSSRPSAKSVVFSSWTSMLDLIAKALSANAFNYQRLDGSMSLKQRGRTLKDFRTDSNCTVLLASLGSAAVGLDLTMATRVHLMEPGWNPLLEKQAVDRIHRLGQNKEVIATRYIVSGLDSIEQYVRQRQEYKMDLIASSLQEPENHHGKVDNILMDLRRTICI